MAICLSTWYHGFHPNQVAYDALHDGASALDAVELGARDCEADLTCMSVGRGGIPDTEGFVTLDASIMDAKGNCGSVAFVRNYLHAISIARRVMERTQYIMLAGEGAELFAAEQGFEKAELLTEKARALYDVWKKAPNNLQVRLRRAKEGEHEYVFESTDSAGNTTELDRDMLQAQKPAKAKNESHDTIGVIAMDNNGTLAGACTTSGLAFKLHGRVGDSPIIGAGLFVVGEVAAAVATGNGELVMRSCATFHIVEMVRQGIDPNEACERVAKRMLKQPSLTDDMQVGLMVIRKDGVWAARSLRPGFQLAAASPELQNKNTMFDVNERGLKQSQL